MSVVIGGSWQARQHQHPLQCTIEKDGGGEWGKPLPNVWLGVSVENQRYADERIPLLLQTPAAVRFVSAEPLLDEVDLTPWLPFRSDRTSLSWTIVGEESGPKARPMHLDWVRKIRDDCKAARVPLFYKQARINGKMTQLPAIDGQQYVEFPTS